MTDHHPSPPIRILLVEDNPGDVRLIREAFREADVETTFHVVSDGDSALEFLHERQDDPSATEIDLVLLDLNLPRTGGFEVLEAIKNEPELTAAPPVLVLTSSEAAEDIARSYRLCANAYLTKPSDPAEFAELGHAVEAFWFNDSTLLPATS